MPAKRRPIAEAQQIEMQECFYAGASSLFKILLTETDDGEDDPTESNVDMMKNVEADIKDYMGNLT